jgi:hypothetical protein
MIDPVTNFSIASTTLVENLTKFTFSFTKPTGDVGGYYLFMSSTGITYINVKTRIDASQPQVDEDRTYDVGSVSYFEYTTDSEYYDGKMLYFKLQALSAARELSVFSSVEIGYSYPSIPLNLFVQYNGIEAILTWDEISFSDNKNSTFTNYNLYRDLAIPVNGTMYDSATNKLSNSSFTAGSILWIIDSFKKSQWFGTVEVAGEFDLTSTGLVEYSDTSSTYTISIDNLKVFIDYKNPALIGISSTGFYIDTAFIFDRYYIYSVRSAGLGTRISANTPYMCNTVDVTNAYPYLRSIDNSTTAILNDPYWKKLKAVLIDKNFYDKTPFAIPYSKDTVYNLKGYLGVSNCKFDVFVNDIYSYTTSTGIYGEFEINYMFPKGSITMVFQARDRYNIKFSRKSAPYSIRTLNLYTWYSAVLGSQYKQVDAEVSSIITDVSIETCRYSYFEDRFSPFVGLYKEGDESETKFISLASTNFKAFEYASYDKSLQMMLDSFQDNLPELDHYEIHYNIDLYDTQRTAYTFTATSTGLGRGDYWYGVAACTYAGEETSITSLRVDRRWWPAPYMNENVIMWDYVQGADFYKIYRGTNETDLCFISSTGMNVIVDINGIVPDNNITPVPYNFTDMQNPANVKLYDKYGVNKLFLRLKKTSSLIILLFGTGSSVIAEFDLQRILYLLKKFIPPELKYTIVFSNDTKVILYPEGIEVNLVEPDPIYANYDLSYYYHPTLEVVEVYS